jgi:hypothetical protein
MMLGVGEYEVTVSDVAVEDKKSGAVEVAFLFCTGSGDKMWGYSYPVKRSGEVNTRAVENLAEVFGWDGDLRHIEAAAMGKPAHIVVADQPNMDGDMEPRVKWINAPGGGRKRKADGATLASLASRLGNLLTGVPLPLAAPADEPPPPVEEARAGDDERMPF